MLTFESDFLGYFKHNTAFCNCQRFILFPFAEKTAFQHSPFQSRCFCGISGGFLNSLNANSFFRLIGQAGGQRDPVVSGGLEIAPVRVGNGLDEDNGVRPGAVDRGIASFAKFS